MAHFQKAFDHVEAREGWYSNHIHDTGKETIAGISRVHWPRWNGWADVDLAKSIPGGLEKLKGDTGLEAKIRDFYKTNFWDRVRGDEIQEKAVAIELFDTAVNAGISKAVKILQEAINLTNRNKRPDLVMDGQIGPKTLGEVNRHPRPEILHRTMNILQGEHYVRICRRNKSQRVFFNGWIRTRVEGI